MDCCVCCRGQADILPWNEVAEACSETFEGVIVETLENEKVVVHSAIGFLERPVCQGWALAFCAMSSC